MDIKTAEDRIDLSRTVIERWERIGMPGGSASDNLRMIGEVTGALERIAVEHPTLAETARAAGARYGALANRIRLGIN